MLSSFGLIFHTRLFFAGVTFFELPFSHSLILPKIINGALPLDWVSK